MLITLLLAAASTPAPAAPAPAAEIRVVLVRHAEAESASQETPDPGLAPAGLKRLECLKGVLAEESVTHVFTSPARRARETAGALASSKELEAAARDPLDMTALATELRGLPVGSSALVVGHSNTLPLLVTALGGTLEGLVEERGQPALPRDQFDRLVRLRVPAGAGAPRLIALEDGRQGCDPGSP